MSSQPPFQTTVDGINLVISRQQVMSAEVFEPYLTLERLVATEDTVRFFRHRLSLIVHGYDSDSRELYEIPEVRTYFRALDEMFPYWFWFADPQTPSLLMIASSCCDLQAYGGNTRRHIQFDKADFANFLLSHFDSVNSLASRCRISKSEVEEISTVITNYFGLPLET